MTHVELEFICDFCGRPVDDKAGCIIVRYEDLSEWRHQDREWNTKYTGLQRGTLAAIWERPQRVQWRIQHDACADVRVLGYDINVDQVRTWQALLCWTSKLMGKTWLPLTDWHVFVGGAADGCSGRIVPAAVRGDAA